MSIGPISEQGIIKVGGNSILIYYTLNQVLCQAKIGIKWIKPNQEMKITPKTKQQKVVKTLHFFKTDRFAITKAVVLPFQKILISLRINVTLILFQLSCDLHKTSAKQRDWRVFLVFLVFSDKISRWKIVGSLRNAAVEKTVLFSFFSWFLEWPLVAVKVLLERKKKKRCK